MAEQTNLEVVLSLKDEMTGKFKKSRGSLDTLKGSVFNLQNAFIGLAGSMVILEFARFGDEVQNLNNKIITLSGDTGDSVEMWDSLMGMAQRSRTEIGAVIPLYQRLTKANEHLGISQDVTNKMTETLVKTLQLSGASTAEVNSTVIQFSQAYASGTLQAQEFNSLADSAPALIYAMADSMDVTTAELKKMGSEGLVTREVMRESLLGTTEEVNQKFQEMPITIGQATTGIKNTFIDMGKTINDETGVFDNVAIVIQSMSDKFAEVTPQIIDFINQTVEKFKEFKTQIGEHKDVIQNTAIVITAIMLPAIGQWITALAIDLVLALVKSYKQIFLWIKAGWKFIVRVQLMAQELAFLIYKHAVAFPFALKKGIIQMGLWIKKSVIMIANFVRQKIQAGLAIAQHLIFNATLVAGAIVTGIQTAAVWLLNAALLVLTSPITLVILAIVALIAIGVLLWKNWDTIKQMAVNLGVGIKNVFVGIGESIKSGMISAINWVIDKLNNFIGFANKIKIPDWAGGDGESLLGIDPIPHLATGTNYVPKDTLAFIHEGEAVVPKQYNPSAGGQGGNGGGTTININNPNVRNDDDLDRIRQIVEEVMEGKFSRDEELGALGIA